ncbi:hypothetical protein KW787_03670 [Candidatus Pacearchaeota archaeon]|nr:hypothetical protein [Candidatus Pacearchaeota archaeon]
MLEDITKLVGVYRERAHYKETPDELVSYATQTSELFRNANISLDAGIQLITYVDEYSPKHECVQSLYAATKTIVEGLKMTHIPVQEAISALEALADRESGSIILANAVYKALSEKYAQNTKDESLDKINNGYLSARNSGEFKCMHNFRGGTFCAVCGVKKEKEITPKKGFWLRFWEHLMRGDSLE